MSILTCKQSLESVEAEEQRGANNETETVYRVPWVVLTSDWSVGAKSVLGDSRLPKIGNTFTQAGEGDTGAFCRRRTPSRDSQNPSVWRVEIEYGPLPITGGGDDDDGDGTPDDYPVTEIRIGSSQIPKVCDRDLDGKLLRNSTGMMFDPLPVIDNHRLIVSVRRMEPETGAVRTGGYIDTINSDGFMGLPAFYVRCNDARGVRRFMDTGIPYWETEWEFAVDGKTWLSPLLDRGLYCKIGEAGAKNTHHPSASDTLAESVERITDAMGVPITEAVPLDGKGGILAATADPVWLPDENGFHLYDERNFGQLQMPQINILLW